MRSGSDRSFRFSPSSAPRRWYVGIGPGFATIGVGNHRSGGRPPIDAELRKLIRQMCKENLLWGAPRIHGELFKLGFELAQSSTKGVAAILLGDDAEALRDLQDRFPNACLVGADQEYEAMVARVVGFVEAPELGLDLPLDVRGTAFQQRVWQALQEIPVGATVTSAELARRIGSPTSVRAVAGACAANKLAVAVPCHRVVRTDGSISGYAWGVERKRAFLDRETSQKRHVPARHL
jgi:O-6-methylguanine DNA methyltransferase